MNRSMNNCDNPLAGDLEHIFAHTKNLWEGLRGQRIFITGGTGFFGCWLLESFAWANDKLHLNASALVLTRNPAAFEKKAPHLFHHSAIGFHQGDMQDFEFPDGRFSHLIHAAVYQHSAGTQESPLCMVNEMLKGTERVLDFCIQAKVKKVLLISTGAVYGETQSTITKIPEHFPGSLDPALSTSAYHHVRRMMENISVLYAKDHAFEVKIARCFSFIGPYIPLNGRFAVSDFIKDLLLKSPITIKGDGKPVRSYLYSADLTYWLWTILFRGKSCWPYNVGSEFPKTIREIAVEFANESVPPLHVLVLNKSIPGQAQDQYIPDTTRARTDIGLRHIISLAEGIQKTMNWYKGHYLGKEF